MTLFPSAKEDFTAENGVTYTWQDNRWRTKAYKTDDSKFSEYLPLTGGTMTGNIAMNGHTVSGLGDPNADAQAANRRYVDTRLKRTGGAQQKMEGILYLGGHKIADVGDPELNTDAANRKYVDANYSLKDLFWKWEPEPGNNLTTGFIHWYESENDSILDFNITTQTQNGTIDVPDFAKVSTSQPFSIYTKDATGIKILAAGTTQTIKVSTTKSGPKQYFGVKVAKDAMTVWRPADFENSTLVICKIGGFIQ